MSRQYFLSKLSDINYRISVHPDVAKKRISSEAVHILMLSDQYVPKKYHALFSKLIQILKENAFTMTNGPTFYSLGAMHNETAVKYIKLLMDIQSDVVILENED